MRNKKPNTANGISTDSFPELDNLLDNESVVVNQTFSKSIFNRLVIARKKKGMRTEQELIRLIVSNFLDSHNF